MASLDTEALPHPIQGPLMTPCFHPRRRFLQAAAATSLPLWLPRFARAAAWPDRPIRMVVPFPAGGTLDVLVRLVTQSMGQTLGQPFVVENRPGAGTVIGTDVVAKAAADGHTLLAISNSFTINPSLRSDLPFDPVRDFKPLGQMASTPMVLCAKAVTPEVSLPAIAALLKTRPDALTYASTGNATLAHLMGEVLNVRLGAKMVHVPFNGSPPALNALAAGTVDIAFGLLPDVLPLVRAGRIRALGVASARRAALAPEIPTLVEVLPSLDVSAQVWFALMAPSGVPDAVMQPLEQALTRALAQPDVQATMAARGYDPEGGGSAALQRLLAAESTRYASVIRQANIKPD